MTGARGSAVASCWRSTAGRSIRRASSGSCSSSISPAREPDRGSRPFLDLIVVWNSGISYGLFQQDSRVRPLAALRRLGGGRGRALGLDGADASRLLAASLGLIAGGASAMPSTASSRGRCSTSCISTSAASAGMCSMWPTRPSLPESSAFCMTSLVGERGGRRWPTARSCKGGRERLNRLIFAATTGS